MTPQVLVPVGGFFLLLLLCFQVLLDKRIIHFKGKLHQQVHRWVAYSILVIAPAHGIFATHTFLGWPF